MSCPANHEAVRDMAAKLFKGYGARGVPSKKARRYLSLTRPADADAQLAALLIECGDTDLTQDIAA